MSIHGNLLHNMSAPPKSVVRYEGLSGMAKQGSPGGSGLTSVSFRGKSLFGTALRFNLPPDWIGLTPLELLARLQIDADSLPGGERSDADPARRLAALLNRRASELPLPDGCAVIPVRANHQVLWNDVLTVLAITSKCTETIWLRSKTPSLIAAVQRESVSLLVPPGFAGKLPEEAS
jgi:hypothetical protein